MNSRFGRILNSVMHGDCVEVMRGMRWASVDFILTDPPYLVNYHDRSGRSIANDNDDSWLKPAVRQMHRVMRPDSLCVSFYGWNRTDAFMTAWREAGFQIVGHIVFRKRYASKSRFLSYEHESAYLLAKGRPRLPAEPVPDVLEFPYSGNRLHPTQKPVEPLKTLIRSFTRPGQVVLDPFCGSGSCRRAGAGAPVYRYRYRRDPLPDCPQASDDCRGQPRSSGLIPPHSFPPNPRPP